MPAPKKSTKVMDGVHSGGTTPNPSSRPVVVTNRPILTTDPMLSIEGADTANTTIQEEPSGEPVETPSSTTAPELSFKDILGTHAEDAPIDESLPEGTVPDTEKKEPESKVSALAQDAAAAHKESAPKHEKIHIAPLNEVKSSSDEEESQAKTEDSEDTDDGESVDEPEKQEDANSAQELEIERHIATGTYFVPIGQVKRRRRMVVTVVILTFLAVVIVINLLLDMELLTLESIPHTSLFN